MKQFQSFMLHKNGGHACPSANTYRPEPATEPNAGGMFLEINSHDLLMRSLRSRQSPRFRENLSRER